MQRFQRFVGLLLVGLAALGAVLVGVSAAVVFRTPRVDEATSTTVGFWHLLYNTTAPSPVVILGATGLGLLLAAAVALVERRVSTRARRSEDAQRMPLAPKLVMAETRGVDAGPVTITVLIPAHDEAGCIAATIASLRSQSHPPERIIVVADNCSDETVPIARARRGGGDRDRRQHEEEGRRAQPGADRGAARAG